jgi:C4-dicarboxylate-specific signal transduction histidine kinase
VAEENKKIIIIRIINIALLLVSLLAFQAFMHYQSLVRQAKDNATFVNRFYAQEITNKIIKTELILKTVSAAATTEKIDQATLKEFLKEYVERDPDYSTIGITDKEGNVILSTIDTKEKTNLADRKYFQEVRETLNLSSGNFLTGRISNQQVIVFGYPILDKNHEFNGVAFLGIKIEAINKIMERLYLPENASITLFDENGKVIARFPEPAKWFGKNMASENEIVKKAITEKKVGALISHDFDQTEKIFAYRPIEYEGNQEALFLASGFSTEVVIQPMIKITLISSAFLFGFIIIVGTVDLLIINRPKKKKTS